MSVNVEGVSVKRMRILFTLTPSTLTLITNLLTNRLNNKYIFRPRSVVSVRGCVS